MMKTGLKYDLIVMSFREVKALGITSTSVEQYVRYGCSNAFSTALVPKREQEVLCVRNGPSTLSTKQRLPPFTLPCEDEAARLP